MSQEIINRIRQAPLHERKVRRVLYATIGSSIEKDFMKKKGELYIIQYQINKRRMIEIQAAQKVNVHYNELKMSSYTLTKMKEKSILIGREVKRLRELVKQI